MANEINVGAEETIKNSEGAEESRETENTETEESEEEAEKPKSKPKLSDEEQLAIHKRELKKLEKKLGLSEEKPKSEPKKTNKESDEFDEGQLAYLYARGYQSDEDVDFVKAELKKAGNNLKDLLNNEYFQAKDKARRNDKSALDASPMRNKRTGQGGRNEAEIHYAKYTSLKPREAEEYLGTLPLEMKTKLVNMRLQKEKQSNQFTSDPVVGNW